MANHLVILAECGGGGGCFMLEVGLCENEV